MTDDRELPQIFGLVRMATARGERPDDPRTPRIYRLGAGHKRFFHRRLGWLLARQNVLIAEILARRDAPGLTAPCRAGLAAFPPNGRATGSPPRRR